ncbi:MAG: hypothetical protein PHV33_08435 [Elusimicrobiales bacterium]|nr:hypothetical protein [Elusimicrobiales bacterium]
MEENNMNASGILMAVLMSMAGGVYAAEFGDLAVNASDLKISAMAKSDTGLMPSAVVESSAEGSKPQSGKSQYYGGDNHHPGFPQYSQQWANTRCFYDGSNFQVIHNGSRFIQSVDSNYPKTICEGGRDVAGLYDGDDFFVFNGRTGKFTSIGVDDISDSAQLVAGNGLAAMYDGDDLFVYDTRAEKFSTVGVDDNYGAAQLVAGNGLAAMYDGDDLFVYDAHVGRILTVGVDDLYSGFEIAMGDRVLLAYDGDDVFAFCGGAVSSTGADDNAGAQVYPGPTPGMYVGSAFFTVNPSTCKIEKSSVR